MPRTIHRNLNAYIHIIIIRNIGMIHDEIHINMAVNIHVHLHIDIHMNIIMNKNIQIMMYQCDGLSYY